MTFDTIEYLKKNRIAVIRLNRPEQMNALNWQMMEEMIQLLDEIGNDDDIAAVIITGKKEYFAAGGDIKAMRKIKSPADMHGLITLVHEMYDKIEFLDKPVIAAISGFALGGGCELTLACDIRIAAENAVFGQPEIKIGVMPGGGGTQRLPRIVGAGHAKALLYTGESIDANEAFRIGLVTKVVSVETLMEEAKKMAYTLAGQPAFALKMIKTAVNEGMNMDVRAGLAYEKRCFQMLFSTEDQKEGMAAFVEKRKPRYTGR